MTVEPFEIENEIYADDYLQDFFKHPEFRNMDEVHLRAQKYIKDDKVRAYFFRRAWELLKA